MTSRYLVVLASASMWITALALAYLLIRTVGWTTAKRHWVALIILSMSLLALPCVGAVMVAAPYLNRIAARLSRTPSVAIRSSDGCSMFPPNDVWNTPVQN